MSIENLLHQRIFASSASLAARFPHVLTGPGDDCAVIGVTDPHAPATLATVDQLVEGRHFFAPPKTPIDLIARKAITRSVSDIAAMGGSLKQSYALATGLLPSEYPHAQELCDSLARWAAVFNVPLVGGDIATYAPNDPAPRLVLTTTIVGSAHHSRGPVLRSTARVGDAIYLTGKVGNSLRSGRHLSFTPRLLEAQTLCDALGSDLHAMIDLSDGLGRDAGRIARASGVCLHLDAATLPIHTDADNLLSAISSGEDYELLFTVDPHADVPAMLPSLDPASPHTPVTRIGQILPGQGCLLVTQENSRRRIDDLGWDH